MDFDKVISKRKSTHSFSSKKVSWKAVLDAVDSAAQGPYAGNINHLHFIIIEDPDTIEKIAKAADQSWIQNASIVTVVMSEDVFLERLYDDRGRVYGKQSAGAAINTFILKLTDLGIGSCWVGGFDNDAVKEILDIPKKAEVEAIIPIGYDSNPGKKKTKKKVEKVIFWEGWDRWKRPAFYKEPSTHDADST
ncbi:MAG: nitroreductase family protein [archaeon]